MATCMIGMSGGVDSSVAALRLLEQGYDCVGVTMKLYDGAAEGTCCSLSDVEDAKSVCRRLGIPHYTMNFTREFDRDVMAPFAASYEAGRTPNPCIDCNRFMKFEQLLARAQQLGCDKIVTGHYARIEQTETGYLLKKAADASKDQSYVLYMLTQAQLSHILFPLGGLHKTEARGIAEKQGFVNAHKRDSQDICFVPDGDYARVIEAHTGKHAEAGDFVDTKGNVLGQHQGIIHYTVGQRRGLGLELGKVAYVCGIDAEQNRVVLGDHADFFSDTVTVQFVSHAVVRHRVHHRIAENYLAVVGGSRVIVEHGLHISI